MLSLSVFTEKNVDPILSRTLILSAAWVTADWAASLTTDEGLPKVDKTDPLPQMDRQAAEAVRLRAAASTPAIAACALGQGRQEIEYPHSLLEPVLHRTLGVPLFQEQLLRMAMVIANLTSGEAEEVRRARDQTEEFSRGAVTRIGRLAAGGDGIPLRSARAHCRNV